MSSAEDLPEGIVDRILARAARGEAGAARELLPLVYDELRKLARSRMGALAPGQTIQATALVHEAYLRMVGTGDPGWGGRAHFFGTAARAMREVLIERARAKASLKRGGDRAAVDAEALTSLGVDGPPSELLDLDAALTRLERESPRKAEVVSLRFFGGLGMAEIAQVLDLSVPTVERDWRYARAWLRREMEAEQDD